MLADGVAMRLLRSPLIVDLYVCMWRISMRRHKSKWPTCHLAGFVISVPHLWSGVMVQMFLDHLSSVSECPVHYGDRKRQPPCLPQHMYVGDWMAHWTMKFTVNQTTGYPHHLSAHCLRFLLVMVPAWWVGMFQVHFKGKMSKKMLSHTCLCFW